MTILITLNTVGVDCSTFDIYSNVDGYTSAFETNVPKATLLSGFSSSNVPNGTITIRIKAKGLCSNYIELNLDGSTTTTTTSTTSTTSTTTTSAPITCYEYAVSTYTSGGAQFINCSGVSETVYVGGASGYDETRFCAQDNSITTFGNASVYGIGPCMQ